MAIVVRATRERSSYHARNAGAEPQPRGRSGGSSSPTRTVCRRPVLLDAYFDRPPEARRWRSRRHGRLRPRPGRTSSPAMPATAASSTRRPASTRRRTRRPLRTWRCGAALRRARRLRRGHPLGRGRGPVPAAGRGGLEDRAAPRRRRHPPSPRVAARPHGLDRPLRRGRPLAQRALSGLGAALAAGATAWSTARATSRSTWPGRDSRGRPSAAWTRSACSPTRSATAARTPLSPSRPRARPACEPLPR